MTVKVITDSTSDITYEIANKLDIGVVPIYVRFGDTVYRDGVDIGSDEFYQKLITSPDHPATSQLSSKTSGTYNSAILAKKALGDLPAILVIDSKFTSAGLGLVVKAAARSAQLGTGLSEVINETNRAIDQVRMLGMFETMKYLARGGRVNKAIAAASGVLNVMPLLTFDDGEIVRAGLVRTVKRGMDKIYEFVKNNTPISEAIIVHSRVADKANQMKQSLLEFIDEGRISIAELGVGLGVHGGPGVLLAAIRRFETKG